MKLIDADTVVTIQVYDDMTEEYDLKKMTIGDAIDWWSDEGCPPSVDAEPVRHGYWFNKWFEYDEDGYVMRTRGRCSCCDQYSDVSYYCGNCGAKMSKVKDNE